MLSKKLKSAKGNLRPGRAQKIRRENRAEIQSYPRNQNIEESDGSSSSSGPFSSSSNRLAGSLGPFSSTHSILAGSLAGTQLPSDPSPILGMKRFMDRGKKNIIGPNMKTLNLKENELAKQKVLLHIEYMSHPPFVVAIDKARTVKNLKQMMGKILSLYNYIPTSAAQMRLLYNGQLQDDKTKLINVLKEGATEARMAMVTTKPIVLTLTDRVAHPEILAEHRQAEQTLNSCRSLLRNFAACNSNTEKFRKPSNRVRFNTPLTKTHQVQQQKRLTGSSKSFSNTSSILADRRMAGLLTGTESSSDWNPILGMKRFMDWGRKNIIGQNMKRLNLKDNEPAKQNAKNCKANDGEASEFVQLHSNEGSIDETALQRELQDDDNKLINVLKEVPTEPRMALATTKPSKIQASTDRFAHPKMLEEHRQAEQALNNCRILLRNFAACNSNPEEFRKSSDRVWQHRFAGSSGPFSNTSSILVGRRMAGTRTSSDWEPTLGIKRFMDWGQKNIMGPNMKRLNLKNNQFRTEKVEIVDRLTRSNDRMTLTFMHPSFKLKQMSESNHYELIWPEKISESNEIFAVQTENDPHQVTSFYGKYHSMASYENLVPGQRCLLSLEKSMNEINHVEDQGPKWLQFHVNMATKLSYDGEPIFFAAVVDTGSRYSLIPVCGVENSNCEDGRIITEKFIGAGGKHVNTHSHFVKVQVKLGDSENTITFDEAILDMNQNRKCILIGRKDLKRFGFFCDFERDVFGFKSLGDSQITAMFPIDGESNICDQIQRLRRNSI